MSQNYSKPPVVDGGEVAKTTPVYNWWMLFIIPAWVTVSFFVVQILIFGSIWLLQELNLSFESIDKTVLNTAISALIYLITLFVVIAVPWFVKKHQTNLKDVGLNRLPQWTDIFLSPAAFVVYFIFTSLLFLLAKQLMPWFNADQVQNTGFEQLNLRYEYILAFITLVVIAPIAEEILFRGYLYGKLKKFVPIWIAIVSTSLVFGAVHGSWNIAIDTFALSIVLCLLRELTGSLWASILLHMLKNGIAFYLLFISPLLLTTLGR